MRELNFTLNANSTEPPPGVKTILDGFEVETGIRVNLKTLPWAQARSKLVNYALFQEPPDVSEVGSSWIGGLWAMNALRPFSAAEIEAFDAPLAYLPVAWKSCLSYRDQVLGVPFSVDLRNILYRRDHFQRAGIDENEAFRDLARLKETWKKLLAKRYRNPWVITTQGSLSMVHSVASWVWKYGGNFMSEDGSKPLFQEPEALEGIYRYYSEQLPYLSSRARDLDDAQVADLFCRGEASSIFAAYWVLERIKQGDAAPKVISNLGVTTLPLPTFIGGTNLVIWRDSSRVDDALKLVRYLTLHRTQLNLQTNFAVLPARVNSLQQSMITAHPDHHTEILKSLDLGRIFSAPYMWGMIEARLLPVLVGIWRELYVTPTLDLRALVEERIGKIANSLSDELTS